MGSCSRCPATWAGHRLEHCPECCHTFTGTTAGDKHRTGDHAVSTGPDRRRCRTAEEMLEAGLIQRTTRHGLQVWGLPGPETPEIAFAVEISGPSSPTVGATTGDEILGVLRNGDVA